MHQATRQVLAYNEHIAPDLLKYKLKLLAESNFRFFRGTNHLFYDEFNIDLPPSPLCWITGDLHVENFGSYKSDNRLVYFDLNDFDDAILAPVAYELVRMVASIFVAFDTLEIRQKKAFNMAKLFLNTYGATLANGKPDAIDPRTAKGIVSTFLKAVERRNMKLVLGRKTTYNNGRLGLLTNNKHVKLEKDLRTALIEHLNQWLKNDSNSPYNYTVKDAVFRRAGTGSIGVDRYALLLKSSNDKGEKFLILDMKQAKAPTLLTRFAMHQPEWANDAERIITIQRRMENKIPALLSTTVFNGQPFVIEELQPTRDRIDFTLIKEDYRDIYQVINDMATLTASAHLRSTGMSGSAIADDLIFFGSNRDWIDPLLHAAIASAERMKANYLSYMIDYTANRKTFAGAPVYSPGEVAIT